MASSTCTCTLCLSSFFLSRACFVLGLPSLRHNKIRDLTANLLTEVCSQVCVKPELQPVHNSEEFPLATSNTQEGARLDIAANGGRSERCFMDVWILLLLTTPPHCLPHSRNMNVVRMASEFVKLSIPLLLPSSCLPMGDWLMKPWPSTSVWLPFWLQSV